MTAVGPMMSVVDQKPDIGGTIRLPHRRHSTGRAIWQDRVLSQFWQSGAKHWEIWRGRGGPERVVPRVSNFNTSNFFNGA